MIEGSANARSTGSENSTIDEKHSSLPKLRPSSAGSTREVLPTLREQGYFENILAVPLTFADALQLAADHQRKIKAQQAQATVRSQGGGNRGIQSPELF